MTTMTESLLDMPAQALAGHRLVWPFLHRLEKMSRFDAQTAHRRLLRSSGTVRDALSGEGSLIHPSDLGGYLSDVRASMLGAARGRIKELKRELEAARAELDTRERFIQGEIDD